MIEYEERFRLSIEGMDILTFLGYVKDHESDFINYLEAIMDDKGRIYLCCPSHDQTIVSLAERKNPGYYFIDDNPNGYELPSKFLVSKFNYISLWYNYAYVGKKINRLQTRSLKLLKRSKLLSEDCKIVVCDDYDNYLYRKSIFTTSATNN